MRFLHRHNRRRVDRRKSPIERFRAYDQISNGICSTLREVGQEVLVCPINYARRQSEIRVRRRYRPPRNPAGLASCRLIRQTLEKTGNTRWTRARIITVAID